MCNKEEEQSHMLRCEEKEVGDGRWYTNDLKLLVKKSEQKMSQREIRINCRKWVIFKQIQREIKRSVMKHENE
jgi:hypothetical protein